MAGKTGGSRQKGGSNSRGQEEECRVSKGAGGRVLSPAGDGK